MKPSETEQIYQAACRAKRIKPQLEEGLVWHKALKEHDAQDVSAAMDAWWKSTAVDSKGELLSRWLPSPGDLIPMIVSANRARRVEAAERKDFVAWKCPGCGYTSSGWTNSTDPKRCSKCGTEMAESHRGRAA